MKSFHLSLQNRVRNSSFWTKFSRHERRAEVPEERSCLKEGSYPHTRQPVFFRFNILTVHVRSVSRVYAVPVILREYCVLLVNVTVPEMKYTHPDMHFLKWQWEDYFVFTQYELRIEV